MADATGSAASTMRAGDVGRAARNDLQFRIPRKPAVRRGVRMRLDDGAWVLDGGRKNQTLGGRFAREHLGALLQACDGTRTLAEIGEATGIGPQGAFEAVCLLWTGGILEEGGTEPLPDPQPAPELACLLSRLGDSTGVNDSWQDAARRLAAARVAVLGDAGLAEELARALEPTLTARSDVAPEPDDTLAVVVETDAAPTADAARRCWTLGIPLLRVRAEQDAVTVGPYVDPGFSPCLECATAGEPALEPPPGPHRRGFVAGLAARAVAALVSRATITHLPGDARRTDLNTFTYTDRPVVGADRPLGARRRPLRAVRGHPPGGLRGLQGSPAALQALESAPPARVPRLARLPAHTPSGRRPEAPGTALVLDRAGRIGSTSVGRRGLRHPGGPRTDTIGRPASRPDAR